VLHVPTQRTVADPELRLSVRSLPQEHRGRVVVEVVGEVDTSTAPVVAACLHSQATRPDVRELVVDLEQVTLLGAAGMGVLARVEQECRVLGVRFVIRCGPRRAVPPAGIVDSRGRLAGAPGRTSRRTAGARWCR
jgi:anti-anti-sigma factor